MITLIVPQFNHDLNFTGYTEVKVKNKPDSADFNKVATLLPGVPQGYCQDFYSIGKTRQPIEITHFYDTRQGAGLRKIKGYFLAPKL